MLTTLSSIAKGAEREILQNVDEETMNKIDTIGMEFHYQPKQWFVSRLQELGFAFLESKNKTKPAYLTASRKS
jgi:hypothetical protein